MKVSFITIGFLLVFLGILLIFMGMLTEAIKGSELRSKGEVKSRGAGIVMIGPFPIIFGTDAESVKIVIILTIILILLVAFLMMRWYP
jgi:uncharacterized protein (TIGR00304 family)